MRPWREVLAERGWANSHTDDNGEWWRMTCDGNDWEVMMTNGLDTWHCSVWLNGSCFDELGTYVATEDAAFATLMAKPIGPGLVTVGVLLGLA